MRILRNKVLVSLDSDIENKDDFAVSLAEDRQFHLSIMGTVVQVPEKLYFSKEIQKPFGPLLTLARQEYSMSNICDCPMELEVGDRVIVSYLAHYQDPIDGNRLIDYEFLVARIRENEIHPLNGYLLIEMEEHDKFDTSSGFTVYSEDVNKYGYGTVKYASLPVKRYLDGDWEDDEGISVGSRIIFDPRKAVRLEKDIHNSLTEGQSSLFKIQRKDVKFYY